MSETIESGAALPRDGGDTASTGVKPAEAIKARAEAVRSWAESKTGVAKDWAADRAGKVKTIIAEEPMMAITVSTATAFVAGAVLGLVIGRLTAD